MRNKTIRTLLTLLLVLSHLFVSAAGKELPAANRNRISYALSRMVDREVRGGGTKVQSCQIKGRRLRLNVSIGLANYPFREESVQAMYDTVRALLPPSLSKYKIEIYTDSRLIEELIPLACRSRFDRRKIRTFTNRSDRPLVSRLSAPVQPSKGLLKRHIALWQSHGCYFDQTQNRWQWQRTPQWQTREDLFTQSFVLPYLVPMLERAGANVLLPRERDVQRIECIVDSESLDPAGRYAEQTGANPWRDGGTGFGWLRRSYTQGQNPFAEGRCRLTESIARGAESRAVWQADIPERGEYAVYVSYRSFANSATDALYTVRHAGGESRLAVNQRMGGGTWVYLGTFLFDKGPGQAEVTLSNHSDKAGQTVVADAVKIGGGYGNIARAVCDSLRQEEGRYFDEVSGLPRFCEGARYWLQWAGFGEEVYAPRGGGDDYKEDYMSRAHWVNALMGGSERLPDSPGLSIPIDLVLAFHSDSGVRDSDETIGTLGIFYTQDNKGRFEGGASRYRSRDLTDVVMSQIVGDIRATCEPEWRRRGLWNRSYYEARVPAAPTMLLELLSHQNFADMRYGHDPRFKFLVARAVYKGILKHIAAQYDYDYIVQPLPVEGFRVELTDEGEARLDWQPTEDRLEPTARAAGYVVYTAVDDGDFDNGTVVRSPEYRLRQKPGRIYRYRVSAFNEGGESFPSETLAACHLPDARGKVLVVNGFTRVGAAPSYRDESEAGFLDFDDGVPYLRDISRIGSQTVFDRGHYADPNPETVLGACTTECETEIIAGNTFDYPALHGRSIVRAGYSFCSASVKSLAAGTVPTGGYAVIDLILGKQRASLFGRGTTGYDYACFPTALQQVLRDYTVQGGSLFVSGSYVASDLWESAPSTDADRAFAREVLHYEYSGISGQTTRTGKVRGVSALFPVGECRFNRERGENCYAVPSPDALEPAGEGACPVARYADSGRTAAVAYVGADCRTLVAGFPFETVLSETERDRMIAAALELLTGHERK